MQTETEFAYQTEQHTRLEQPEPAHPQLAHWQFILIQSPDKQHFALTRPSIKLFAN